MKNVICLGLVSLFVTAVPAQAQVFRRPVIRQVITSPFVHELVNFGLSQLLPGFPPLPPLNLPNASSADTTIYVDGAVKRSNEASAKYLGEAKTIMDDLMVRNRSALEPKAPEKKDPEKKALETKPTEKKEEKAPIDDVAARVDQLMKAGHDALGKNNLADAIKAFRAAHHQDPSNTNALALLLHADSQDRATQQNKELVEALINAFRASSAPMEKLPKKQTARVEPKKKMGDADGSKTIVPGIGVKEPTITEIDVKKKGDTKLPIDLEAGASGNLTVTAFAVDADAKILPPNVLFGKGEINKDAKSGEVIITVFRVPNVIARVIIEITDEENSKVAEITLRAR